MSERSTRRAAEMKIIDAANQFVEWGGHAAYYNALAAAVLEHQALGLEIPNQPAFSNNSTATSAAAPIKDKVGPDARRCFDEILIVWQGGGLGLTCDQIEQATGFTHQNASARVNGLRDGGWIVDSTFKRKTRSGRPAIVWTPTFAALTQEGLA